MCNIPSKASNWINIIKWCFQVTATVEATEIIFLRPMRGLSQIRVCDTWATHLEGSEGKKNHQKKKMLCL